MPPVVIVGAGPAGLAAGGALRRAGVESVLLERGPAVATSWRGRHESLRLNTVRWQSGLPGLRIPRSAGRWVSRDDYVGYLERYAAAHRLDIRPGVHVQRLDPVDDGWRVTTSAGAGETNRVVVATGHDRVPWLPEWPGRGSFVVPVMHVSGLQRPSDLAGLRVLLVGAGNSGVEIGGHLVDAGVAGLWVSVRTPPNLMPREIAGVPVQPAGVPLTRAPERLADSVCRLLSRLAFGDLSGYGLPAPELGPYARLRLTGEALAVDEGFVAHLRAGRVTVVPEVSRLDGQEVVLADGSRLRPDVVLAATGFRRGLEPLVGHLDVLDEAGLPRGAADGGQPARPGLWFIGYRVEVAGSLRLHAIDARRMARAMTRGA
ncbi:MAG: flavin-containing monooxygenase [Streptosporangiaceae bacterium]